VLQWHFSSGVSASAKPEVLVLSSKCYGDHAGPKAVSNTASTLQFTCLWRWDQRSTGNIIYQNNPDIYMRNYGINHILFKLNKLYIYIQIWFKSGSDWLSFRYSRFHSSLGCITRQIWNPNCKRNVIPYSSGRLLLCKPACHMMINSYFHHWNWS
jgi:hypothetical protein